METIFLYQKLHQARMDWLNAKTHKEMVEAREREMRLLGDIAVRKHY